MDKLVSGKKNMTCDCQEDCIYSRYTIDVQDKMILERTTTAIWKHPFLGTDTGLITTDEIEGTEWEKRWYNMGRNMNSIFVLQKHFK